MSQVAGVSRRLRALVRKETAQVLRDPAALLIAFVLPVVLLFLFAYAVSLDIRNVKFGVVLESDSQQAHELAAAFAASRYLSVTPARNRAEVEPLLVSGELRGFAVIPSDFDRRLLPGSSEPAIQIITDAAQPNTANFTAAYAQGVFAGWQAGGSAQSLPVTLEPRFWFNPELESRLVLLPGAIAIVMTMIGTLLTALVVAREWERGTMEAIMATPASMAEILFGKLVPYFVLGLVATIGCTMIAVLAFQLPFRGSAAALLLVSSVFLIPALGQGLLISVLAKNQFIASQIALMSGFLPSFLLSGFLFEIDSMPGWIQVITHAVPARYYVASLQTIFVAGDVWWQLSRDMLAMLAVGAVFYAIILMRAKKRLD